MHFSFSQDYFQDEKREGFLVTEAMKRYWAAGLHTVEIFAEICEKYDLHWWADYGTLLGAYRHGGFVPWDDDIDVGMMRKDYDKFLEIAPQELPKGWVISRFDSGYHQYNGITVVVNHYGISFDEQILGEYYNCPFPVGFDLYPYEYTPTDLREREIWKMDYMKHLVAMEAVRRADASEAEVAETLAAIGLNRRDLPADRTEALHIIAQNAEKVLARYSQEEVDLVTRVVHLTGSPAISKEWFLEATDVSFETDQMRVLTKEHAESYFRKHYGEDWRTPKQFISMHDYPLYRRDIEEMIQFLEKGGMRLGDLPPMLEYIRREADLRKIPYRQ